MRYPLLSCVLACLVISGANAATITLAAVTTGWYQDNGAASGPSNLNYIAGTTGGVSELRDFFVFDLSSVSGTIISAQLQAYNPSATVSGDSANGFASPNSSDTYELFDVSTSISSLSAGTGGLAAFNDLGSGTVYGTRAFTSADNGTLVSITLNAAAITALNGAHAQFAFGGIDASLVLGQGRENIFAWTDVGVSVSNGTRQLVLQTVPEPATLSLVGISAIGLFLLRRRQS